MEQFDAQIEQYKRELMRYAKENGTVYPAEGDFETVEETKDKQAEQEPVQVQENAIEQDAIWKQYKKGRPMPTEYSGEESVQQADLTQADKTLSNDLTQRSESRYKSFEDFSKENPAKGMLRVQAFAAQQAFPITNARVEVEKDFEDGTHRFIEAYTDINGIVENITLPTKEKSLSQSPNGTIPYTTYTVRVSHPLFSPLTFCQVPVFDAIESLQPVAMTPVNRINQPNK